MSELTPLVLLGGSFDPVHFGHLRAALDAAQALGIAQVTLLPAGAPALRDPLSVAPEHRLAMLKLAIGEDPALAIDDCELRRPGATYTAQTLRSLREQWPDRPLIFLLGADAFSRLEQWQDWQSLLQLAHLGVLTRPGLELRPPSNVHFQRLQHEDPRALITRPCGHWCSIAVTPLAISATSIRTLLADRKSPRFLLPDPVLRYIQKHRLYQSKP